MASKTWCRLLISVFLLFTVAEFVVRGPLRVATDGMQWNDFMSPYIQAKAWLLGKNPYRTDELLKLWPTDNLRPLFVDRDGRKWLLNMLWDHRPGRDSRVSVMLLCGNGL